MAAPTVATTTSSTTPLRSGRCRASPSSSPKRRASPPISPASSACSSVAWSNKNTMETKALEIRRVLDACGSGGSQVASDGVHLWKLRELALSDGGLVDDSLRKRAWPKLVGINRPEVHDHVGDNHPVCYAGPSTKDCKAEAIGAAGDIQHSHSFDSFFVGDKAAMTTDGRKARGNPTRWLHPKRASVPRSHHRLGSMLSKAIPFRQHRSGSGEGVASAASETVCGEEACDPIIARSLDMEQIEFDVTRCTWHLLSEAQQRAQEQNQRMLSDPSKKNRLKNKKRQLEQKNILLSIQRKQSRLSNLINLTLVQSYSQVGPERPHQLRYYQGYHDVACIFLSTLGTKSSSATSPTSKRLSHCSAAVGGCTCNQDALGRWMDSSSSSKHLTIVEHLAETMGIALPAEVLLKVSNSHLSDYMKSNFNHLQTTIKLVVYPLLARLDPSIHEHLYETGIEPYFVIPWVISWYSHDIRDTDLVKRIFDVLIVSHPLMPLYLAVAFILHPANRAEVMCTERDLALMHGTIAQLPKNSSTKQFTMESGRSGFITESDIESRRCDDDDATVSTSTMLSSEDYVEDDAMYVQHGDFDESESHRRRRGRRGIFGRRRGSSSTPSSACLMGSPFTSVSPTRSVDSHESDDDNHSTVTVEARVPIQEVIDIAIEFMRQVPPKQVLDLSRRYYGNEVVSELLNDAEASGGISMLQEQTMLPPPSLHQPHSSRVNKRRKVHEHGSQGNELCATPSQERHRVVDFDEERQTVDGQETITAMTAPLLSSAGSSRQSRGVGGIVRRLCQSPRRQEVVVDSEFHGLSSVNARPGCNDVGVDDPELLPPPPSLRTDIGRSVSCGAAVPLGNGTHAVTTVEGEDAREILHVYCLQPEQDTGVSGLGPGDQYDGENRALIAAGLSSGTVQDAERKKQKSRRRKKRRRRIAVASLGAITIAFFCIRWMLHFGDGKLPVGQESSSTLEVWATDEKHVHRAGHINLLAVVDTRLDEDAASNVVSKTDSFGGKGSTHWYASWYASFRRNDTSLGTDEGRLSNQTLSEPDSVSTVDEEVATISGASAYISHDDNDEGHRAFREASDGFAAVTNHAFNQSATSLEVRERDLGIVTSLAADLHESEESAHLAVGNGDATIDENYSSSSSVGKRDSFSLLAHESEGQGEEDDMVSPVLNDLEGSVVHADERSGGGVFYGGEPSIWLDDADGEAFFENAEVRDEEETEIVDLDLRGT